MMSLPDEVLLYIESSTKQRNIILLQPYNFLKDSSTNKEIIPISKKVHVFLRHPVGLKLDKSHSVYSILTCVINRC